MIISPTVRKADKPEYPPHHRWSPPPRAGNQDAPDGTIRGDKIKIAQTGGLHVWFLHKKTAISKVGKNPKICQTKNMHFFACIIFIYLLPFSIQKRKDQALNGGFSRFFGDFQAQIFCVICGNFVRNRSSNVFHFRRTGISRNYCQQFHRRIFQEKPDVRLGAECRHLDTIQ